MRLRPRDPPKFHPDGPAIAAEAGALVSAYAARLHAMLGDGHHAASPLGAWLLLALVAPDARGAEREEIERALGCPADRAWRIAHALLAAEQHAVRLAMAIWSRSNDLPFASRAAGLERVSVGPVPTQAAADAWVSAQTLGLVERFPGILDPTLPLLLTSAVATDVSWAHPFDCVDAAELEGPWATGLRRVMTSDRDSPSQAIARTTAAGLVGVQIATSHEGLRVVSVIAEAGIAAHDVIAAAHEVAALVCGRPSTGVFVPLSDLPPWGHAWEIDESEYMAYEEGTVVERYRAILPAWKATASHRLGALPESGFPGAARACLALLPPGTPQRYDAEQVARAEFDVRGFRAAAVTTLYVGMAMPPNRRGVQRRITIRFARPFAAVAVAFADRVDPVWHGIPAFSAWVTEPCEPDETPRYE